MLEPLHLAHSDLFARDWFVADTPTYMRGFNWLAQWLFLIDREGSTGVIAVHVVVTLATYAAIYWLVSSLHGGWRGLPKRLF